MDLEGRADRIATDGLWDDRHWGLPISRLRHWKGHVNVMGLGGTTKGDIGWAAGRPGLG